MEHCPWSPAGFLPPQHLLGLAMERHLNHPMTCTWLKLSGLANFTVTGRADAVDWRGLFLPKSKVAQRHLQENAIWHFHVIRTRFHPLNKILNCHPSSFTRQTGQVNNPFASSHLHLSEITNKLHQSTKTHPTLFLPHLLSHLFKTRT